MTVTSTFNSGRASLDSPQARAGAAPAGIQASQTAFNSHALQTQPLSTAGPSSDHALEKALAQAGLRSDKNTLSVPIEQTDAGMMLDP